MRHRRLRDLHHTGPFFSTDAGGAPNSAYGAMGASDGVPASTNIPGLQDFLGTISTLQVPELGVYTPWGVLEQAPTVLGYDVRPLSSPPETNILAFEFAQVAQLLSSLGFGQPSFLAILSPVPLSPESVSSSLLGTPYKVFDTGMAVYSQGDGAGIPAMHFLYWIQLRDPGDPQGGSEGVGAAAQGLGATLVFAQQVPIEQTTSRAPPTGSPTDIARAQYPSYFGGVAPPAPPPPPGPTSPDGEPALPPPSPNGVPAGASSPGDMVAPVLVGVLAAIAGFALTKKRRR